MAVLKDLIVHGASRFLNKSYFDSLEADNGAFKKIIAKDATVTNATVMGLLDVTGELHTKSWSNSNIATIDGSFYITPTFGLQGGDTSTNTVTVAATSLSFTNSSGTNFNFDSLYLDGSDSAIAWTTSSKVIVTGEILKDGEWIPLGTLKGTLGTYSTTSVVINNITDAKGAAPATLAALIGSGLRYRNVKVSLISINRSGLKPLGIFMTATGANGRTFLDIYGGNNAESSTYAGLSTPVLRIGNLKGLPSITLPDNSTVTPNGWGIYTTNGFFTGTIVSTKGKIGNFTLDTALHAGTNGGPTSVSGTTAGTYVGTDGFLNYASNTAYVKMTGGVITAVGAVIKGDITADSGTIGGITANLSYGLYTNSKTSATSTNTGFLIHKDGAIYLGAYDSTSGVTSCPFQVTAAGSLTARSGRIGKFNLTNTYLYTGSGSTMAGIGGDQAFWAGNSNSSSAPFHVSYAGVLNATGATISGILTAGADSSIGPWTVTDTSIYKGNATHGTSGSGNMYFGNSGLSISDKFLVDNAGNLSATGAVFKNVTLKDGSNNTRACVDDNGMRVYDNNGVESASFGATSFVGRKDDYNISIEPENFELNSGSNNGSATLFRVGASGNPSPEIYQKTETLEEITGNQGELEYDPINGTNITVKAFKTWENYGTLTFTVGTSATKTWSGCTVRYVAPKTFTITGELHPRWSHIKYTVQSDSIDLGVLQFGSRQDGDIGNNSATIGNELVAPYSYQTVVGKHNVPIDAPFVVGIGSPYENKNAFTVDWNGDIRSVSSRWTDKSILYNRAIVYDCKNYFVADSPSEAGARAMVMKNARVVLCGRICQLVILATNTGSVASGGNFISGTFTGGAGTYQNKTAPPFPRFAVNGVSYYGKNSIIGLFSQTGVLTIRNASPTALTIGSANNFTMSFTYIVEDDFYTP